jgi:3-hydroxyisobutyrate dehydrogenase-like beta-hydroxyacid dehydrogenase
VTDEQGTVGLIGLGQMGGAMCRTLLRAGWRVVAWDLARAAVDAAAEAGAEAASDPAGVASRAEVIITSVPDVEAVREAALGDRGIVRGDCAGRLLIDTSTLLAADARALAADLAPHGVGFLDAPVSGGVRGAESGQLAIMVGGSVEHFERAGPVLACLGKAVVHCGPVGAGQITKSCNQLVVMATHESIAETLVLAQACGLDPWRVREALLAGYGASPILEIQGPRMLEHDFAPGGKARYHLKDIAAISELAREAGLDLPVFSAAARQFERLVDAGGGDLDNSAVITVIEPHRGSAPPAGG